MATGKVEQTLRDQKEHGDFVNQLVTTIIREARHRFDVYTYQDINAAVHAVAMEINSGLEEFMAKNKTTKKSEQVTQITPAQELFTRTQI